jgi:TolA-binding protein
MSKGTSLLVVLFFLLLAWGTIGFAIQASSAPEEEITLEQRMAKMEGILEQIVERLNSLDNRMNSLESRLDTLNTRLDELIATFNDRLDTINVTFNTRLDTSISGLRQQMNGQFWTLLSLIGLTWATTVAGVLTIVFTRKS